MQSADVSESIATNAPRDRMISLALFVITLAVYWPAAHCEFNNFDDAQYITKNPAVQHGFTAQSITWAFTTGYAGNWHPLTWLSHMLDWQLYGANAGGHHLTNVLLHAVNAVLLFWLFRLMTGAAWPSAFVAALFAWHPLHVESVAWVAERKDVLSGFFGLLTLIAYYFYARNPDRKRYALVLLLFTLGLMSKPMLVTLPLIMLLLDFWPLGRIDYRLSAIGYHRTGDAPRHEPLKKLLLEKAPLFALTLLSCLITMRVQKSGGAMSLTTLTLSDRIANAVNSYVTYIGKILWPHNLAVFYPYLGHLPVAQIAGAALLLLAITAVVLWSARKLPHLLTGWLWFFITLLPVIGLVQVGEQALADRYTYLPAIGLFVMLAWQAPQLLAQWPRAKPAIVFAACALAAACLAGTSRQIPYWRNSATLFAHALDVTTNNALAHCNLGEALAETKPDDALIHFNEALRLKPDYLQVLNNKGSLFRQLGRLDDAAAQFNLALQLKPDWALAHRNLGLVYFDQNKLDDAIAQFRAATQSDRTDDQAFTNLGLALARQGKLDDAIAQYRKALALTPNAFAENGLGAALETQGKLDDAAQHYYTAMTIKPDFAEAHNNLGVILNQRGKFADAQEQFETALKIKPDYAEAHCNLGNSLFARAQFADAAAQYTEALRLQSNYFEAHLNLAMILSQQGNDREAIAHFRAALQQDPKAAIALKKLAWILATSPDGTLRDGAEAVRLATQATQTDASDAQAWDTLGAACAETGQFTEAVGAAKKALELCGAGRQQYLGPKIQERLALYKSGRPFRENPLPAQK